MELTGRRRRAALLLGLALPLAACTDEAPATPDTRAGDVIEARNVGPQTGKKSVVLTPAGRLTVRFADPVQGLEEDETSDLRARSAPEGGSFVPIVWTFEDDVYGEITRLFGDRRPLEVALVADGEKHSLTPPDPGSGKTAEYVAVEGSAKELGLEVTYDGLTQTVDAVSGKRESGVAEQLYDLPDTKLRIKNCPIKEWFTDPTQLLAYECRYATAIPTPYFANEWVAEGHTYLAVTLETHLVRYATAELNGSIASYEVVGNKELSTIDGAKPEGTFREQMNAGAASGTPVWLIQGDLPKTLRVMRRYQLTLNGAVGKVDAPQKRTVKIGGDVTLIY